MSNYECDMAKADAFFKAAAMAEKARVKIMGNPNDPSWTENFAELIQSFEEEANKLRIKHGRTRMSWYSWQH